MGRKLLPLNLLRNIFKENRGGKKSKSYFKIYRDSIYFY
jgi:hypothetical protein